MIVRTMAIVFMIDDDFRVQSHQLSRLESKSRGALDECKRMLDTAGLEF